MYVYALYSCFKNAELKPLGHDLHFNLINERLPAYIPVYFRKLKMA